MKRSVLIVITLSILFSCGNRESKAKSDQKKALSVVEATQSTGYATTEGGWAMMAKIDGKQWTATSLRSPDETGWINGDYKEESIKLPYERGYMVVGKKIILGDNHPIQLFMDDDSGESVFFSGKKGEMEITKVDDKWAEGKFYFTATVDGTDKRKEVTDGFFRISMAKQL